jgi:hypothetical protein
LSQFRKQSPGLRAASSVFRIVERPVAKVIVNRQFPEWMYVDSGADITLLPFSIGELVGLRLTGKDRIQRIFGVGRSSVPVLIR